MTRENRWLITIVCIFLIINNLSGTEFTSNVRVDDGSLCYSRLSAMDLDNNGTIYVVMGDAREGGFSQIYFTKSEDRGESWLAPNIRVSDTSGWESNYPDIACGPNGTIYVTFRHRPTNSEGGIFFTQSSDGGHTWTDPDIRVDDGNGLGCWHGRVQPLDGDALIVVWYDFRGLMCSRSLNAGLDWSMPSIPIALDADRYYSTPNISKDNNGHLYVAGRYGDGIHVFRSSDNGQTWSRPVRADDDRYGIAQWPDIAVSGDKICVVYLNTRGFFEADVIFSRSTDEGHTWTIPNIIVDDSPNESTFPRIGVDNDGICHIVYQDNRAASMDIYYTHSEDGGFHWESSECVNDDTVNAHQVNPNIWVGQSQDVCMTWSDDRDSSFHSGIYFARTVVPSSACTFSTLPAAAVLYPAYPNPFNSTTKITFDLKESGFVNLKVFNLLGQEIETLISTTKTAGTHSTTFNAKNLPSGIYLYRLEVNDFISYKKMLLVK